MELGCARGVVWGTVFQAGMFIAIAVFGRYVFFCANV
jgi:hypothetical protein